jgi:hypothetical protein
LFGLFVDANDLPVGLAAKLDFAGPSVEALNADRRWNDVPSEKEEHRSDDNEHGDYDGNRGAVHGWSQPAASSRNIAL